MEWILQSPGDLGPFEFPHSLGSRVKELLWDLTAIGIVR
jgi:hypothetical protein